MLAGHRWRTSLQARSARALKEIAAQTGFCHAFHLSRQFKASLGQTPRQFRNARQAYAKATHLDPGFADGWNNLAEGAEHLRRFFPAIDRIGIAHYINGPSNYTPDGNLVLGSVDGIDGLFVATGCNGAGISVSGGVGRLIAELVAEQAPFVDPAPHRPQRRGNFDPFAPELLRLCAEARSRKTSG